MQIIPSYILFTSPIYLFYLLLVFTSPTYFSYLFILFTFHIYFSYLLFVFTIDYIFLSGNTFIVNVALADLLVSGLVVPASAVVILAGLRENLSVCRFQWFLATLCFLVTVLSLAAVATENYYRLCFSPNSYEKLTRGKITVILLIFWILCACISGVQFVSDVSFDYCRRKYLGLIPYQATVSVVMVFLPLTVSVFAYIRAGYQVRRWVQHIFN